GRRYNDDDVERLQLLKQLTSRGLAIRVAVEMSDEELVKKLRELGQPFVAAAEDATVRVALLHPQLEVRLKAVNFDWNIVACAETMDALSCEGGCDVLICDLDLLGERPNVALERLGKRVGANDAVVLYHFGRASVLRTLSSVGVRLLQEPIELGDLHERVEQQVRVTKANQRALAESRNESNPVPRFSAKQLARLRTIQSSVDCECPNHLASLLTSLSAFERYSKGCVNSSPEDALLHRRLYEGTGAVRQFMEQLLEQVLAEDGISLESLSFEEPGK
ncbi:MAG: hypothetical protein MK135_12340, partial [Polyangiaceae bacterium]|nr:hypothetical protein [Polyangiaceae bacterium]